MKKRTTIIIIIGTLLIIGGFIYIFSINRINNYINNSIDNELSDDIDNNDIDSFKDNDIDNDTDVDEIDDTINRFNQLSDIKYDNKKNVYLFWGNGCPHCEEEIKYLISNLSEYEDSLNIYMFEVWYDNDNEKIMNDVFNYLGESVSGVPATIIGNEIIMGFSSNSRKQFNEKINNYIDNDDTIDVFKELFNK